MIFEKHFALLHMMNSSINLLTLAICLLLSLSIVLLSDLTLKKIFNLKSTSKTLYIGIVGTVIFLCIHGFTITTLLCAIVFQTLLFASVYDIKTHTVPNYVHIIIISAGLLNFQPLPSFMGLILVPLPFLIAALQSENSIGGGDIKFMSACGFVLGVKLGFIALILGLVMAVLCNTAFNKEKKPFALIPYLTLGCFVALVQIQLK